MNLLQILDNSVKTAYVLHRTAAPTFGKFGAREEKLYIFTILEVDKNCLIQTYSFIIKMMVNANFVTVFKTAIPESQCLTSLRSVLCL